MHNGARVHYLDPDFRRDPKTDCSCCVCQRDINPHDVKFVTYVAANGFAAIHPDDVANYSPERGELVLGWQPIGPECARKIPAEFKKVP